MANTLAHARQRFFDAQGVPLAFGKVWTYDAGTTVPRPTFADAGEVTANPNPVILDVNGEATIYWRGTYKVNLTTSADAQVPGWPEDDVTDITTLANASVATLTDRLASIAPADGASLVGAPGFTGATLADWFFGPFAEGADVTGGRPRVPLLLPQISRRRLMVGRYTYRLAST